MRGARANENPAPHLRSAPDQVQRHDPGPAKSGGPVQRDPGSERTARTPSTWTGGDHRRSHAYPDRHHYCHRADHVASAPTHQPPLRSDNHPLIDFTGFSWLGVWSGLGRCCWCGGRGLSGMEVLALSIRGGEVPDVISACPDLTAFCRLDELGLEVTGQRLGPDRAVLACRVVDSGQ